MTLRRARWEPVVNEVLLAAGPPYRDGLTREWGTHHTYATTAKELALEPTSWADVIAMHAFTAMAQTDPAALRTSLIALAGQAVSWVFDLDMNRDEAA